MGGGRTAGGTACEPGGAGSAVRGDAGRLPQGMRSWLPAVAGLAPYWFLLRRPALFYSLAGHDDTVVSAVGWYLAYLALVVAAVLAAAAFGSRVREGSPGGARVGRWLAPGLTGLLSAQAALKVLEVLVPLPGAVGFAVALLDTALYAVVLVCLTYLWAVWCVETAPRCAALVAIGSFTLSFFVKLVGLLPEPATTMASAVLPLLSGACWLAAAGGRGAALAVRVGGGAGVGAIRGSVRRAAAVLVVFLIAGGVFRGVAFGMVSGGSVDPRFSLEDAVSVAVALLVLAYYLAHASMLRLPWFVMPLSVVVFFAGLLLMTVLAGDQSAIGGGLVVVGRTGLGLLLWITLVDVVRARGLAVSRVFGVLFVLVDVVSSLLGYVVVPFAVSSLGFSLGTTAAVLSSTVAFVLIAVSVLLFGRTLSFSLEDGGADDAEGVESVRGSNGPDGGAGRWAIAQDSLADRWWDVVASCGLTERETQVAILLAEGNGQKRIAERLGVSVGTVQTHVKGVYRKLGVHSRQELIDLAAGAL